MSLLSILLILEGMWLFGIGSLLFIGWLGYNYISGDLEVVQEKKKQAKNGKSGYN